MLFRSYDSKYHFLFDPFQIRSCDWIYSLKRIDSIYLLSFFLAQHNFNTFFVIWYSQLAQSQFLYIYIYTHTLFLPTKLGFLLKKKKKKTNGLISGIDVKAQKNIVPVTNITWTGLGFDIYKKFLSRLTQKLMPTHKAE